MVVDASIAAKWLFPEEHSIRALNLLTAATRSAQRMIAPPLFPFEVTNTIRRRMRVAGFGIDEAIALIAELRMFGVGLISLDLHEEALVLADRYGLPAAYDAHYLALAEELNCDFWTDDRRLLNTLSGRLPFVRWIGSFNGTL